MPKYIEKNAAILTIEEYADRLQMVNWKENPGVPYKAYALNWCINTIRDLPPADVRPVKRGKWVKATGSYFTPGGDSVWECSECGKGRHVYGIEHYTYSSDVSEGQWVACPNCGADMSGGDTDG